MTDFEVLCAQLNTAIKRYRNALSKFQNVREPEVPVYPSLEIDSEISKHNYSVLMPNNSSYSKLLQYLNSKWSTDWKRSDVFDNYGPFTIPGVAWLLKMYPGDSAVQSVGYDYSDPIWSNIKDHLENIKTKTEKIHNLYFDALVSSGVRGLYYWLTRSDFDIERDRINFLLAHPLTRIKSQSLFQEGNWKSDPGFSSCDDFYILPEPVQEDIPIEEPVYIKPPEISLPFIPPTVTSPIEVSPSEMIEIPDSATNEDSGERIYLTQEKLPDTPLKDAIKLPSLDYFESGPGAEIKTMAVESTKKFPWWILLGILFFMGKKKGA